MSLAILVAYSVHQDINLGLWLPLIAGGAAVIENVAVRGLDNLLIPLFVALLLGLAS
jgi:dolichol kinase